MLGAERKWCFHNLVISALHFSFFPPLPHLVADVVVAAVVDLTFLGFIEKKSSLSCR